MKQSARVIRSRRARRDLVEIWKWIAANDPRAADALLDRVDQACEILADTLFFGAPRDDLCKGLRHFVVRPYIILYRATGTEVVIVRVVDGRRDLHRLFGSRR